MGLLETDYGQKLEDICVPYNIAKQGGAKVEEYIKNVSDLQGYENSLKRFIKSYQEYLRTMSKLTSFHGSSASLSPSMQDESKIIVKHVNAQTETEAECVTNHAEELKECVKNIESIADNIDIAQENILRIRSILRDM